MLRSVGFLIVVFSLSSLYAQNIGPVIQGEKRPTTKDPSYQPSIMPFYLQQKTQLSPVESYILNPSASPEEYLQNQQNKKKELPIIISKQEEDIIVQMNQNQENIAIKQYYLQKYFLPQLGRDYTRNFFLSYLPEPAYHESKWQRRFTIFMLSFPITTGLTYGLYKGYKSTSGLNHQESIGIFGSGILFSLYIVYYDNYYNTSLENYAKYLRKN